MDRKNGFKKVIVTDCSRFAPALYIADGYYIVPEITTNNYLITLLDICQKENIHAVLPLLENELTLIARNKQLFKEKNILTVISDFNKINLCRDKFLFSKYLKQNNISTIETYSFNDTETALKQINQPIFIKPRYGCGSIGTIKIDNPKLLNFFMHNVKEEMVLQPYIDGEEFGVDAYIDLKSKKLVSIFAKKKLRMRAGETEKSISAKDSELFSVVNRTLDLLGLVGPVDIDIMKYKGIYYVLEINPRFGGGYPHAYECGVNFPYLLSVNAKHKENVRRIGNYKEGVVALKYSELIIKND